MSHLIAPSVNLFVIRDGKVLLGRRTNTGWKDGFLWPPGGHVEAGETPSIAMLREIREELGIDARKEDLEFACVAARNNTPAEYVAYVFMIRDKNYAFMNAEPEKCSELVWVPLDDLPADIVDDARQMITKGITGKQTYLEIGYEA